MRLYASVNVYVELNYASLYYNFRKLCCTICALIGNGIDFDSSTTEAVFLRRATGRNVFIPIIDDSISEPLENFSLAIELDPQFSSMGVMIGNRAVATGFIIDDDEGIDSVCNVM